MGRAILTYGALIGAVTLAAFAWARLARPDDLPRARSLAFSVLVLSQLLFALSARSPRVPVVRLGVTTNRFLVAAVASSAVLQLAVVLAPPARPIFQTVVPSTAECLVLVIASVLPLAVAEMSKPGR